MRRSACLWFVVGWVLARGATAQPVQGDVVQAGFPVGPSSVFRVGQWFPIQVRLTVQGSRPFAGLLRAGGEDLDGDLVAYTERVALGPETPLKRFWLLATADSHEELWTTVDVLGEQRELVTRLPMPAQPLFSLGSDDLLILDLSYPALTALDQLTTRGWSPGHGSWGDRVFYRNIVVSRMDPAALPDTWFGLEAVNVVVWDRPDPAVLSIAQADALVDWVRAGGQLVLGIGPNWAALRGHRSELAAILPLQGEGRTVEVDRLPVFSARAVPRGVRAASFERPIPVVVADLAPGALRTLGDTWSEGALNLFSMRLVESGRVTACAASLRDLLEVARADLRLFHEVLDLNAYARKYRDNQNEARMTTFPGPLTVEAYPGLVGVVGFTATTALSSVVIFLFAAAYVLLSTLATWVYLQRAQRTHLSWVVFAGWAAIGSAAGLATVAGIRGTLSRGLQSLSVLDLEAGQRAARGPVLFGYSSPTRQEIDLSLPGPGHYLRPLPKPPGPRSTYVTPDRYEAEAGRARLSDVLVRATLKQFAGYWRGELPGTIRGELTADRATGRLTPGSFIANDLEVPLAGGWLLFIDPRHEDAGVPIRAAGLDLLYDRPEAIQRPQVPPAYNILAVWVPAVAAGGVARGLGADQYKVVDELVAAWRRGPTRKRADLIHRDLPTLWREQQSWLGSALAARAWFVGRPERMLLLASTRGFLLPNADEKFDAAGPSFSTEGLPELDVTHWLLRDTAVLLCWSPTPGPAALMRGTTPVRAGRGLTLYRVRLPLTYVGSPPRPGSEP